MIHSTYFTAAIIVMAMITFAVRYSFFSSTLNIRLHPKIKVILIFTAPCILTAMFIPIMFKDLLASHSIFALFKSSFFWASLAAIFLSLRLRNTLFVILLSMGLFYLLRFVGFS